MSLSVKCCEPFQYRSLFENDSSWGDTGYVLTQGPGESVLESWGVFQHDTVMFCTKLKAP